MHLCRIKPLPSLFGIPSDFTIFNSCVYGNSKGKLSQCNLFPFWNKTKITLSLFLQRELWPVDRENRLPSTTKLNCDQLERESCHQAVNTELLNDCNKTCQCTHTDTDMAMNLYTNTHKAVFWLEVWNSSSCYLDLWQCSHLWAEVLLSSALFLCGAALSLKTSAASDYEQY